METLDIFEEIRQKIRAKIHRDKQAFLSYEEVEGLLKAIAIVNEVEALHPGVVDHTGRCAECESTINTLFSPWYQRSTWPGRDMVQLCYVCAIKHIKTTLLTELDEETVSGYLEFLDKNPSVCINLLGPLTIGHNGVYRAQELIRKLEAEKKSVGM